MIAERIMSEDDKTHYFVIEKLDAVVMKFFTYVKKYIEGIDPIFTSDLYELQVLFKGIR